ncbi:zinc-binding dehydrogenase [Croceicoccus sp. YJ47]|uniref:zinc-binding dehydrogenase n=1 Tax=Croceicoccus sp. YJ47 TaxID=2798724 RepID=UPI001922E5AF|nr:zinc-binding dehydrogenase [Croceicoccus sp. YJ47]QQN74868.1 zinc-binding dehydrogenase [Croceicoccus sp. YJ47]
MTATTARHIYSKLASDGTLTVSIAEESLPEPTGSQVLIEVEAAPVNPSDLGLLFGSADLENAEFGDGTITAQMPAPALRAMQGRVGEAMPVGIEGAGRVVAAGDDAAAQELMGRRVACAAGGMYATHRIVEARECMTLPDDVPAELGAASYVNPMTALGFTETLRAEGGKGIVHTAAASNLGQMLVKICAEDDIPLVNIVRSDEQVKLLRDIGATHVVNSSDDDFFARLKDAIAETGAMTAFDAIGGGRMASTILTAMEQVASANDEYSRYGSSTMKRVHVYGALDLSVIELTRSFGFVWTVSGWLLMPFLTQAGRDTVERMRGRVRDNLTGMFASQYSARGDLSAMLRRENALSYNAKKTGEKFLVTPNG